jgi:hypothetical protein
MSIDKRQPPLRRRAATQESQPHEVTRKALLAAGALSSLLYVVATDVVAASRWDGYRRTEQMVSELFAVGSPGRDVLLPFTWLYTVLFTAFGVASGSPCVATARCASPAACSSATGCGTSWAPSTR